MQALIDAFVKFADTSGSIPEYVTDLSVSDFGKIDDPKTRSAVFLSAFAKQAGVKTRISQPELNKRARLFGIDRQIKEMVKAYNTPHQPVKTAAEAENYPIRSAEEWKKAADWIAQNGYALQVEDRRMLAGKIVKKAAEYKQETTESLEAMAGMGKYNPAVMVSELVKRAKILKTRFIPNPQHRDSTLKTAADFEDLAEAVATVPNTSEAYADKLAAAVQCLDNECGLHLHYGSQIKEPDLAVRPVSDKTRRDINTYAVKLADGSVYDRRDFSRINPDCLTPYFGTDTVWDMMTDFQIDVNKMASAVEQWDIPEAELLVSLLAERRIRPKTKVAESLLGRQFIEHLAHYA
jgi:DNA-binding transcriptional regulator of glucitol operon